MLRTGVSSRASQLCRLPTIQKARNGAGHRRPLHDLLQLHDPSALASPPEEDQRPIRQRHPCRAYHTSSHQPILPLIVGCVAAAGGYVVYRKLQGLPTLPNEATKAKEAYRKQQEDKVFNGQKAEKGVDAGTTAKTQDDSETVKGKK